MPRQKKDLTLAEIAEEHRKANDEQAARLGVPVPYRPVPIASLPSALRAINDDHELALRGATPAAPTSAPRIRTAFGEEQETSRLQILKGCDHVRTTAGPLSDAGVFASAVKAYLTVLGAPNSSAKEETLRKMREAVARMSTLQTPDVSEKLTRRGGA